MRRVLSNAYRARRTTRASTQASFRSYSQQTEPASHDGLRVAIVGSGPAGFYTARKLMREIHDTKIDMYEQLPVPFGLVRFGVAPDHPEVKNCQDEFEEVASSKNYNFVGNVQLGHDLPLALLAKHYDAIVFSYGASKDRQLGVAGEEKASIYSARAFVGWYNGLPEYRDLNPNLGAGETAIVVGQGNVALDVARTLLSDIERLKRTDITEHAIDALSTSKIKHVHVVGRRGPMQAAFTIKEIRELIQLDKINFKKIPDHLFPPDLSKLPRPKKRLMELLRKGKPHDPSSTKSWSLEFLLSPKSLDGTDSESDTLTGVTFTKNEIDDIADPSSKVTATEETETIAASTLFRSIGYKAEAIPGMELVGASFDERRGTLRHDGRGRIVPLTGSPSSSSPPSDFTSKSSQEEPRASLYCAGWVKRGPTGVIAGTMADAFETAETIVQDWRARLAAAPSRPPSSPQSKAESTRQGWTAVKAEAEASGLNLNPVHWSGWHKIDAAEKEIGMLKGKPREKFGRIEEMLRATEASLDQGQI